MDPSQRSSVSRSAAEGASRAAMAPAVDVDEEEFDSEDSADVFARNVLVGSAQKRAKTTEEITPPSRPSSRASDAFSIAASKASDYYLEKGNSKPVLLAMCIGLIDGEPQFCVLSNAVDPADEFYMNYKKKARFKYKNSDLVDEVKRRHKIANPGSPSKSCNSWGAPKLIEWLKKNPVRQAEDIDFLTAEEEKFRAILKEATAVSSSQETTTSGTSSEDNTTAWTGPLPFLRMYHCMIDDDVREAYAHVHDWEGREGIDARNSAARPPSFFELTASKYNDSNFVVDTLLLPELHSDFSQSKRITAADVPKTTGEKIKKKLADSKVKLFRVISDWEMSGNGNGQRSEERDDFGHIEPGNQMWKNTNPRDEDSDDEYVDGDNRASFLRNSNTHILYMWHLFDEHDLLKQTLTKLNESSSVSSTRVPVLATGTRRAKEPKGAEKKKKERERVRAQVGNALQGLAVTSYHQTLDNTTRELMRLQERLFDDEVASNPNRKALIESQIEMVEAQLSDLRQQKEKLF